MKRKTITIENDRVHMPLYSDIWMSQYEIAGLLDCFISKVSANIRAILKADILRESEVCRTYHYQKGNSVEQYNLEMIIALSFRVKTRNSDLFREWMINKVMRDMNQNPVWIMDSLNKFSFSLN